MLLTRDHLFAIGALTADEQVSMHHQLTAFRGPRVVHVLRHLLRQSAGKLLVIWDRSPIHRAKVGLPPGEAFLAEGGAHRLWLE